jgi:hypothetical protein
VAKQITLDYLKEKIQADGQGSLTPREASAYKTFKRAFTEQDQSKRPNIVPIAADLDAADTEQSLSWYREQLDTVDRLCWDKAIEGLSSNKAQGKWCDFMNVLKDLRSKVDIGADDLDVEIDFDPVATSEVFAS